MMPRVIRSPVACLMLVVGAILGVGYSSAHAQAPSSVRQTPHLVFSTYLGGSKGCFPGGGPLTFAQSAACDAQGNTYVTGATQVSDLPVLHAYQPGPAADSTMSAFVAKYDPTGKPLWCTYLGGNKQSKGAGVAAMPDGGVAVAGLTTSDALGPFPTSITAFQAKNNGQSDYFVSVFDANGNLKYSTYLGGSGVEGPPAPSTFADDSAPGNIVAVDAAGLVYVTGFTDSGGGAGAIKFPVTHNALQNDLAGMQDAFLCIIDPSKTGMASLVYSSYLGGTHNEQGHCVAVEASGRQTTVAGFTHSSDFPTTANALRRLAPPPGFLSNGFVTRIESSFPGDPASVYTMSYSTYLGADTSDARDDTYGIALDPKGLIVATGRTQSAGFPMTTRRPAIFNRAPYLKAGTSGDEPYLVKINPSLNGKASLVYSTFLGGGSPSGQWGSFCTSVGVDAGGTVYVAGETCAPGVKYARASHPVKAPAEFPYTQDALLKALQGSYDATFMQIKPGGSTLGYSTYLGGKDSDRTYGLGVDPFGNVVLAGLTFSADFPLINPAQTWPGNAGFQNAFVTKFSVATSDAGAIGSPRLLPED